MNNRTFTSPLRLSAALLLVGQLLYFVVTLLHTGGPANDHPTIFAAYAGNGSWTVVHIAQFACVAMLVAGLLALSFALGLLGSPLPEQCDKFFRQRVADVHGQCRSRGVGR